MDHQQNMSGFTNSFFFGGRSVMEMQCFLGGVLTGNVMHIMPSEPQGCPRSSVFSADA